MGVNTTIERDLARLKELSPSGFAIAFHVRFATAAFIFQTYPKGWLDIYSEKGLVMQDPIVQFGFGENGTTRWSALSDNDPAGVLDQARDFDMNFGIAMGIEADGTRSVAGFARPDREYTDAEIAEIEGLVLGLHLRTLEAGGLSEEAHAELKRMAVLYTHPGVS